MSTKIPLRADAKTHIRTPEKTSCTVGETHAHTHALLSLGGEVRGQIQIMMLRQLIILSGIQEARPNETIETLQHRVEGNEHFISTLFQFFLN